MTRFAALDASQKMTAVCVVDDAGRRMWRGQCPTVPEQINAVMRRHAGDDARIGIETGGMTPWLVHELRNLGLEAVCLDARHARAAAAHRKSSLARAIHLGWAEQKLILNPNWPDERNSSFRPMNSFRRNIAKRRLSSRLRWPPRRSRLPFQTRQSEFFNI